MNTHDYDAIVIGSGAGGTATAYRLILGGLRVALLEKGSHLPADGSTLDISRVVHDREYLSREEWLDGSGRAIVPEEHFNVGGKTKWYGAALLRFAEHEFAPDAAHGCAGWPITLRELAPYYTEAERLLGVRTFECEPDLARILARVAPAGAGKWHAQPMPMGLADEILMHPTEAAHFDGFASVRGLKGDAERSILALMRSSPRFTLATGAEVVQLVGRAGMPRAVSGVRLADGREFRAPRIFLAAGALHSPRLLARYLETAGLMHALPAAGHVGRHLKLHLLTALVSLSPSRKLDLIRKTIVLTNEQFPHSSVQPLGFDGELIGTLMPRFVPEFLRTVLGERAYGFFLQTEDGSDADNRVHESPLIEGGTVPVLDYDERRQPQALREHRAFTRAFQIALAKAGMLSFTKRIGLAGTAHACGSLRCGKYPQDSVVDDHGRVHGMSGLYVVDGSVLPRSSRVNPSLSIYAWGLRVGDLVVQQFAGEKHWPALVREVAHAD
jgi:choline dehydrogenase-like flavoprotein